ncbi:uncharacterized protein LOC144572446 isoform X2 [Carex rostrata]|jgi:translation initiation factor 3 subunit J
MEDDWESEDFHPVPPALKQEPVKSKWEDEEEEDDDVKESWEDDDETVKETKPEPVVEKSVTKPSTKGTTKKGKQPEPVVKHAEAADEVLSDPVAEKLRQQRLVEEADFKAARELFGKKGNDEKTLDNFIPKSESDFMEYAEMLSDKIRPFEKSFHYNGLLKAVIRLSMTNMKAADAKEISSSVNAIANEKLKLEKEAQAGKKKGAKNKKQLHVEKGEEDFAITGTYNDADDFDFM